MSRLKNGMNRCDAGRAPRGRNWLERCRVGLRLDLARLLALVALLNCSPAFALLMNLTAINTSDYPFGANDLHLTLTSTTPIPALTVTQTAPLGPPVVTGAGSKTVTLDWTFSGTPLHKGQGTTIGLTIPEPGIHSEAITATEFYWTFATLPIPNGAVILVPKIIYPGLESSGGHFAVLHETVFSGPPCAGPACVGPLISGDYWFAAMSSGAPPILENTGATDIWVTTSIGFFDRELSLGELNPGLAGMGPTSPITLFAAAAVPEPATWLLLGAACSGLLATLGVQRGMCRRGRSYP